MPDLNPEFTFNLIILIGAITPFVTAVLAKINTPDWYKGLISITLAAISGFATEFAQAGTTFDIDAAVGGAVMVWSTHVLTYFGISADAVRRLHNATARVGLPLPKGSHPIL